MSEDMNQFNYGRENELLKNQNVIEKFSCCLYQTTVGFHQYSATSSVGLLVEATANNKAYYASLLVKRRCKVNLVLLASWAANEVANKAAVLSIGKFLTVYSATNILNGVALVLPLGSAHLHQRIVLIRNLICEANENIKIEIDIAGGALAQNINFEGVTYE